MSDSPFPLDIVETASMVLEQARLRGAKIATAESCTGGLIIGSLTEIAGSSDIIDRGFITYANEAKMAMLGITEQALKDHGAVSEQVARAMALGALVQSDATLAVSCTGVAGPGGGSKEKPVGLVHMAVARQVNGQGPSCLHHEARFGEQGRAAIRLATVRQAHRMLLQQLAQL